MRRWYPNTKRQTYVDGRTVGSLSCEKQGNFGYRSRAGSRGNPAASEWLQWSTRGVGGPNGLLLIKTLNSRDNETDISEISEERAARFLGANREPKEKRDKQQREMSSGREV